MIHMHNLIPAGSGSGLALPFAGPGFLVRDAVAVHFGRVGLRRSPSVGGRRLPPLHASSARPCSMSALGRWCPNTPAADSRPTYQRISRYVGTQSWRPGRHAVEGRGLVRV